MPVANGMPLAAIGAGEEVPPCCVTVISANASGASDGVLTALGLLLLLAACGKSAQVPLQSWRQRPAKTTR